MSNNNLGNVFVDAIPGAVVGGILGFLALGTHKLLTTNSNKSRSNLSYSNNEIKKQAFDLLSFKPVLFDVDKTNKFTSYFLTLGQFRTFEPTVYDQAGRLVDQFLSRYKSVY